MKKTNYNVIGVMSGTSLDGIDLVYVDFDHKTDWSYRILQAETVPYPLHWKEALAAAVDYSDEKLADLNKKYTYYLAEVISRFIEKNQLKNIDAVCSHGHTIKHEPQHNYTLQIGNLPEIAYLSGQTVICDFRVQDVNLGGQGAPLVPIGDQLLFPDYKYCLNLGGFANVSTETKGGRLAYDICAVNTVLNYYAQQLGREYDEGGKLAATGRLNKNLLEKLNKLAFYSQDPPKSLGIEWVKKEVFPLLYQFKDIPDILHTFTVHIARQVAHSLDDNPDSKVLMSGGGTFNNFLMRQFKKESKCHFTIPSQEIINYKEAVIFGLLGVLKLRDEVNVLSSVTGAESDHSSGVIFEI